MFTPRACFKGAALVWALAALRFHSALAGLAFAVIPLGFGVAGLWHARRSWLRWRR